MVKLVFNPEKNVNSIGIVSKSSKRKVQSLNPFKDITEAFEVLSVNEPVKEITTPSSTKELVGLENTEYILNQWYTTSLSDKSKPPLLVIGPVGCGKSSLINLYCIENGIMLYNCKTTELIKTKKELIKELLLFAEYSSTSFFTGGTGCTGGTGNLKKLILIDEYQNGQNDLLGVTDISQLILLRTGKSQKELKGVFEKSNVSLPPIIIISADARGSKLNDLKKISEVYYIGEINHSVILNWISKLYNNLDQKLLLEIIKKCKSDKRLLLTLLNFLKTNKTGSIDIFIHTFYKDSDINNFECTSKLFDKLEPLEINEIFKVYDTDGFMICNLIQENYLDYSDSIENIAKTADSLSLGETIFSDTYESSKVFSPEAHCVNSICIPSYYSRSEFKKNKCQLRTNCGNNRYNIYLNNKKMFDKIISASNYKLNVTDILYIKKFLNQDLIKSKTITVNQEHYLKTLLGIFRGDIEKLELIYKYFSEFKDLTGKETKTKNFTLKFKEKLNKLV
jgi:DNA polymerase III delta prime subunit